MLLEFFHSPLPANISAHITADYDIEDQIAILLVMGDTCFLFFLQLLNALKRLDLALQSVGIFSRVSDEFFITIYPWTVFSVGRAAALGRRIR